MHSSTVNTTTMCLREIHLQLESVRLEVVNREKAMIDDQ